MDKVCTNLDEKNFKLSILGQEINIPTIMIHKKLGEKIKEFRKIDKITIAIRFQLVFFVFIYF